jgi:hypothetical protein
VAPDLRVASTQGGEHGEGDQLPHRDTDPTAGEVVAETVRGQEPLEVQLVLGRRRVHALHPVRAGDLLLHRPALTRARVGRSGPGVEPAVPEHLVEGEVVEDLDQLRIGDLQR